MLFFLVYLTPCEDWTIGPLMVSTACGKYLDALEYVNPGHVSGFPFLIALSHEDLTGNPSAACIYRARSYMLVKS